MATTPFGRQIQSASATFDALLFKGNKDRAQTAASWFRGIKSENKQALLAAVFKPFAVEGADTTALSETLATSLVSSLGEDVTNVWDKIKTEVESKIKSALDVFRRQEAIEKTKSKVFDAVREYRESRDVSKRDSLIEEIQRANPEQIAFSFNGHSSPAAQAILACDRHLVTAILDRCLEFNVDMNKPIGRTVGTHLDVTIAQLNRVIENIQSTDAEAQGDEYDALTTKALRLLMIFEILTEKGLKSTCLYSFDEQLAESLSNLRTKVAADGADFEPTKYLRESLSRAQSIHRAPAYSPKLHRDKA